MREEKGCLFFWMAKLASQFLFPALLDLFSYSLFFFPCDPQRN